MMVTAPPLLYTSVNRATHCSMQCKKRGRDFRVQEWPAGGGIISSSWVTAKNYLGNTLRSATKDVLRERAEVSIGWSRHWYILKSGI